MSLSILARHPRDLTVAWAQRVVDQKKLGITVSSINVHSVDVGTTTRIRVTVEHNGLYVIPRHWFVKIPSLSWRSWLITALPRLLFTEVSFYKDMSHVVSVNKPTVLAAQSKFGRGVTLVLADVTEYGAIPGVTRDSLTIEQVRLVIEQLALLHASFWNNVTLDQEYSWLGAPIRKLEDRLGKVLAVPLMKHGLKCAGSIIPTKLYKPALQYARQRGEAMHLLSEGPRTLTHHDCHPGNLFWDKSQPGLLDWQLVRIGEGVSDIAYLLATTLEPKIRKVHEASLLVLYQKELKKLGIKNLDTTKLFQRYRAHLIYPFEAMVVTLAVGGMMERESNLELIRRATAAVEDQKVFDIYNAD
ncbi:MAG: phosphotransferase [Methylococcales bacterium]|nr:phosphotransferase [Methylococcales bacterium]